MISRCYYTISMKFKKAAVRDSISILTSCLLIFIAVIFFGNMNSVYNRPFNTWAILYYVKTIIEIIASCYAIFYFLVAVTYKNPSKSVSQSISDRATKRTIVAYLCCDDFDRNALESILVNNIGYNVSILIHDDSSNEKNRMEISIIAEEMSAKYSIEIQVVRRLDKQGGKPGAINNLLQNIPPDTEYLLLCDSDSYILDRDFLPKALSYFSNPDVALVQFRIIGNIFHQDSKGYKLLSQSVAFYDVFVSFMDKFGWSPFLGHNAIIRISALKKVGGFTPGQLADDIDFSIKLRLSGYRIRYAREIVSGERHPLDYSALRRRTHKWTYGCTQILRNWGLSILSNKRIGFLEKTTFFLTVSYYHFQILLLLYLTIFYLLLPFSDSEMGGISNLMVSACLILLITFMPSISYFKGKRVLPIWPYVAAYWGIVYGSQDFVMLRAIFCYILGKKVPWIPTNVRSKTPNILYFIPELLFGGLIIVVAVLQNPSLLLLPTTLLFAGKFLISPFLNKIVFERSCGHTKLALNFPSLPF